MKDIVELKIYNQQDRLDVAGILLKNGYTVSQVKKSRNSSGNLLRTAKS